MKAVTVKDSLDLITVKFRNVNTFTTWKDQDYQEDRRNYNLTTKTVGADVFTPHSEH